MINITKKTKIVATIGPASDQYTTFLELVRSGMNVMRLNFSHGDYAGHLQKIELARRLESEQGIFIPVMLDTRGPEIRLGMLENDGLDIPKDHVFFVTMEPVLGTLDRVSVSYRTYMMTSRLVTILKLMMVISIY